MANKEASFKTKKYEILKYMKNRQIANTLQRKVTKYLDYIQLMEDEVFLETLCCIFNNIIINQAPQKGHDILNELSLKLRQ